MNAVDTNVLIYAHDPRDVAKQQTAIALLQSLVDGVLVWQVACEFLSASRKLEPLGFQSATAWQEIRDLRSVWTTITPSWNVLDRAQSLGARFSLSFWDSLLLATCIEARVTTLYSEDFTGYAVVDGLQLVNPFANP
jgi:predicted nucleic acid-binding protein